MKFTEILFKTKEKLLDMLYPNDIKCIFCGRDILNFDERPFCDDCEKLEIENKGNRCKFCDMKIPEGNLVCDFCAKEHKAFEKAYCPLVYNQSVRSAILKLKSDNARYLAKPFAKLICERIGEDDLKLDYIIPVPIHAKTKRKRGYNQAELLANEIGKILNVQVLNDILIKEVATTEQKKLTYIERLDNVKNSFSLKDKKILKNKSVLIVDDVMTTGATLDAVSRLFKGTCRHIYVCAVARDNLETLKK